MYFMYFLVVELMQILALLMSSPTMMTCELFVGADARIWGERQYNPIVRYPVAVYVRRASATASSASHRRERDIPI